MHIEILEKKWLYAALAIVVLFVLSILYTAIVKGIHPPSHVETVDSTKLHLRGEFAEDNLGVHQRADGSVAVTLVAARYGFYPRQIEVPAETPITFRVASADVLHGLHLPMTNLSTMVVPGYVAQVTTEFPKPGEYPLLCNEFCGLGHDHMYSRVTVVARQQWRAPTAPTAPQGGN